VRRTREKETRHRFGETTEDGLFTLKEGECFGACGDAPVFLVNNHEMQVKVTPERFDDLIDACGRRQRSSRTMHFGPHINPVIFAGLKIDDPNDWRIEAYAAAEAMRPSRKS
jgi:NADH dehydrogenase subunit E (EC 1.6.5.3)